MIELRTEDVASLTVAAEWFPPRRKGRKPNVSTLYRWAKSGCRGIALETVQVGGTKCTSREAVQRFVERLTHGEDRTENSSVETQRSPRSDVVGRELDEAGL